MIYTRELTLHGLSRFSHLVSNPYLAYTYLHLGFQLCLRSIARGPTQSRGSLHKTPVCERIAKENDLRALINGPHASDILQVCCGGNADIQLSKAKSNEPLLPNYEVFGES